MFNPLRLIAVVLAGGLLAALTGMLLAPFLPPNLVRYVAIALAFGAITFLEEAFLKKNRNALRQAGIAAVATSVILFVLDQLW